MLMKEFPNIKSKSKEKAREILPLLPSPELAMIVAALMSDGHLDWHTSDGRPRTRKILLYSSEKEECTWFLNIMRRVFSITGKIIRYKPNHNHWRKQPYKTLIHCAVVSRILIISGVPVGNKTKKEFLVPDWIMNGGMDIKRAFLRTFLSFEGSVPYRKKDRNHTFQMGLLMNKSKKFLRNGIDFVCQIRDLLSEFNVSCSSINTRENSTNLSKGGNTIYFSITRQTSILFFYLNVGFLNKKKQARLESCIKDICFFHRIRSDSIGILFEHVKNIIGTDKGVADHINTYTFYTYSKRQMEHFRRNEISTPMEVIYALMKIKKDRTILEELPVYVRHLYNIASSAPSYPQ